MENVGRLGKDLERGKVGGREGREKEEERGGRRKRGEGEGWKREEGVVGRKWGHVTYYTVPAVGCRLSW